MTRNSIIKRIYPSIVTHGSDWQSMMKDVGRLGLTEVSVFLTGTTPGSRKQLYRALDRSAVKFIPHVHARDGMQPREYEWFMERFGTNAFVMHYGYIAEVSGKRYSRNVFIENNSKDPDVISDLSLISAVGGMGIDLSHYAHFKKHFPHIHKTTQKALRMYKIGCNHISAIDKAGIAQHYLSDVHELDYLAKLPQELFSSYLCIELTNTIGEQLEFREYIATLLANTWNKKS